MSIAIAIAIAIASKMTSPLTISSSPTLFPRRAGSEWLSALGYTALCYDMFGHGYSDHLQPPHDYKAHTLSHQLTHLLAALDIYEPVHVVGFSLGCSVAAHFAHEHPSSVRSLTLIAPAAGFNVASDFAPRNPVLNLLAKVRHVANQCISVQKQEDTYF